MLKDFRYAFRALRQNPGFAATAIVSIALGIGANSAIFSFADGLFFRPLPVPHSSGVVTVSSRTPSGTFGNLSYRDFSDFRRHNQSFEGMVAYHLEPFGFARDARSQPQLRMGFLTSANFFQLLGVVPRIGRGFRPDEDEVPGRDAVIVLSYDFWKTEFEANPAVIGQQIRLNARDYTVIGVAPESFTGLDQYVRPAFFVPLTMGTSDLLTDRANRVFQVKGRLKPGMSILASAAEIDAMAQKLQSWYPDTNRSFGAAVRTELQTRTDDDPVTPLLLGLFFIAVMIALAIACANVANLVLSRGRARAREIAVRLAVGASRGQLIRQLMAESLLIATAGGALGLVIAEFAVRVFSTMQVPGDVPVQLSFQLDTRVVWFTALIAAGSAILLGLFPALRSTRVDLIPALKTGEADQARRRFFGRSALVVVQVAGSLVLLVAAAQLYRAFSHMLAASPGFRTSNMLLMRFDPGLIGYNSTQTEQFYNTLRDRSREVPGIKWVGLTYAVPMTSEWGRSETVIPEGYQFPRGKETVSLLSNVVDYNYFATFAVPIVAGRGFLPTDRADSPRVVVVNQAFAQHYLGEHPVGKRLRLHDRNGPWMEVVGVTATGKYVSLLEPTIEYIYLPLSQNPQTRMTMIAQTSGDPLGQVGPLREVIRSIDSNLPVFGVRTMEDLFDQRSVKVLHLVNAVVGVVGLIGFGLALVGLYAVVSYQVALRRREIGIRMALGAHQPQVMRMILKQAAMMGGAGVSVGLVLSVLYVRAIGAALSVPAFDPLLFSLVPVGLLLTTLVAASIPARRAARLDPMSALRQE